MSQRKRIGLYYESYATYPAFVIYVQNLVRTLMLTPDAIKPQLVILHLPDSPINELQSIEYPFIEFYLLKDVYKSLRKRIINKSSRYLINKNLSPFTDKDFPKDLDAIFPYNFRAESNYVKDKIIWKPDFQEFHLPTYFTPNELSDHKNFLDGIAFQSIRLILSSEDSRRDYERYYPNHTNEIIIWPFTSYLPDYSAVNIQSLKQRYAIVKPYFVVANQFWPHKNHINVLKALVEVLKNRSDLQVVFTGKQTSHRDKDLFAKLQQFIQMNELGDQVIFTGFIERTEQLALIKNSIAVVQPSTFEGWSTVIEDCKALNHLVIASNLSVNKEQILNNVLFFDPYDYKALAKQMLDVLIKSPQTIKLDYMENIKNFNGILNKTFKLKA